MASNELFQYSVISALMDGVAESGLLITDLLSHGNHGLGTFRHMVGEMIILDGNVYQMKSDGTVTTIDEATARATIAPFAMATRFQPSAKTTSPIKDKQQLSTLVSDLVPDSKNHFLALRVDGVFRAITVRTVPGQTVPHERLKQLAEHQVSHTFESIRGTVIGFRSPAFMQGISVVGDHLHFISEDRSLGGHILACEADGEVAIAAASISKFHLELPRHDDEFNKAQLALDAPGIAAVEG